MCLILCCESDPDLITTVLAIAPSIRAFILTPLLTNFLIWAVTMISYNTNLGDASCFFCILLEQLKTCLISLESIHCFRQDIPDYDHYESQVLISSYLMCALITYK
ncbi:hypothetical protein GQX74_008586 [Glossina fuscipes]|nr:hypothetical protein GQX74_008586 [Glossina fuscipes]